MIGINCITEIRFGIIKTLVITVGVKTFQILCVSIQNFRNMGKSCQLVMQLDPGMVLIVFLFKLAVQNQNKKLSYSRGSSSTELNETASTKLAPKTITGRIIKNSKIQKQIVRTLCSYLNKTELSDHGRSCCKYFKYLDLNFCEFCCVV